MLEIVKNSGATFSATHNKGICFMENDKIRIVIDCDDEKETPQHWLTVGNVSRSYSNEADLADDLELLLEEDTSPLAA